MNIYVYSDESGVFDKVHNEIYVLGGIILLSKIVSNNIYHKAIKDHRFEFVGDYINIIKQP